MAPKDEPRDAEREQTDESLRVEREKVDEALEEEVSAVDETADSVITLARVRADEVLAAARAKTDRQSAAPGLGARLPATIERERALEHGVLQEERTVADEIRRSERAAHVATLSREREETDKDLSNERARADDALATRDEFLGIVSHDLRNMLNAMVGFAGLIENSAPRENQVEQVLSYARRIRRAGGHMNRLIGDLVDVASIEAGVLRVMRETGDVTQVVTEAVEAFQAQASASQISLAAEIAPPPLLAAFDSARILQVLTNLLSNALKFTPAAGQVVVHVERAGDEIQIAVRDTGVGIPHDKLEKVFVRFLQVSVNDRRGVGLGLYISKAIVQGHGGRIWAESTVGEGSTFAFTLPVDAAP